MQKKQITTTASLAFIYIMFGTYASLILTITTANIKFSAAIGGIITIRFLWQDIRIITAGQKFLFIKTAPLQDE